MTCFEGTDLFIFLSTSGNLLLPFHAVCVSHGSRLGRLQYCGEVPRDKNISQRVRGLPWDGSIHKEPKRNEWRTHDISKISVAILHTHYHKLLKKFTSEKLLLNQMISRSWYFSWFSSLFCLMMYWRCIEKSLHGNSHLTPDSDKRLISPNSITPESYIKVMRTKEMIATSISSWLLDKFSL